MSYILIRVINKMNFFKNNKGENKEILKCPIKKLLGLGENNDKAEYGIFY